MSGLLTVVFFLGWLFSICLSMEVAAEKSERFLGFIMGVFFGPLGILTAYYVDKRPCCKACFGKINAEATVCQHCRIDSPCPTSARTKLKAGESDRLPGLKGFLTGA